MFPGLLQEDPFKGKWSLCQKLFQTKLLSCLSHKVCRLPSSPVVLRKFANILTSFERWVRVQVGVDLSNSTIHWFSGGNYAVGRWKGPETFRARTGGYPGCQRLFMRGLRFQSSQTHKPVNFASLNLCSTRHSSLFFAHQPFVQRDSSLKISFPYVSPFLL